MYWTVDNALKASCKNDMVSLWNQSTEHDIMSVHISLVFQKSYPSWWTQDGLGGDVPANEIHTGFSKTSVETLMLSNCLQMFPLKERTDPYISDPCIWITAVNVGSFLKCFRDVRHGLLCLKSFRVVAFIAISQTHPDFAYYVCVCMYHNISAVMIYRWLCKRCVHMSISWLQFTFTELVSCWGSVLLWWRRAAAVWPS